MKITKIEQEGDIFIVTKTPRWISRVFGKKDKICKYKDTGKFHALSETRVYINQKGAILARDNKITDYLENWRRRF